ncbi:ABC transporter ATP-binding protein [Paenibacillus sp. MBLB4367]|uniref:ABC transporter ATP-binding protein n=1 Tax=Paenibacillus sp. MBLB4367 TaxID=3384767 RepID=UPI0039082D1B
MSIVEVSINRAGYPGREGVINDIHFTIEAGQLIGLIGPNGAGKSTTIKAILGLLPDVAGTIGFTDPSGRVAYIPEHPVLYDTLTLWEHLELAASALEMETAEFEERGMMLLKQFRLTAVKHHLPSSFSKGMQQKMMLIIGFLQKPDLYIIDEPFIGLDPKATKDFMNMLHEERKRGAGVLMSTHVLDTAERLCDAFVLLADGQLVASGDLEAIREQCGMPGESLFDCFHSLLELAEPPTDGGDGGR